MQLQNFTPHDRLMFLSGGVPFGIGTASRVRLTRLYENARFTGQKSSIPQGYTQTYRAWVPSLKQETGRVAASLRADSSLNATVVGTGEVSATLSGNSSVTANPDLGLVGFATLQGNSTFSSIVVGKGKLSARLDVGAQPSAFDIAQEVLGTIVESGVDMRSVLRILVAVAAGKTNIDTGGPDPIVTFRDTNDTKDRVTATMAASERIDVDLDVS